MRIHLLEPMRSSISETGCAFCPERATCLIADYGKELPVLEVGLRCHRDGGQWAVLGLMQTESRGLCEASSLAAFRPSLGWPRAKAAEGDGCTFAGGIAGGTSSADGCAAAILGRTV